MQCQTSSEACQVWHYIERDTASLV